MNALKTERFELRLDQRTIDRLDAWRAEQDDLPSRAEAMRRLVEQSLGAKREVQFTDGEKLLLVMMGDLYKALNIQRGEIDPNLVSSALFGGHNWAFRWEMSGLFDVRVDAADVLELTVDILDMWSFLEEGYAQLKPEERDEIAKSDVRYGTHVSFPGFDGNNESEYYSVARFLVRDLGRFARFKDRELNSHSHSIYSYKGMLREFIGIRANLVGTRLNKEQILTILRAG